MMPWQRLVADVGCELDADGMPAYRQVVVTVPRQSGKTTLFLAWQLHRCLSARWDHPQRSVFTAQTGRDARDKWLDELFPLIRSTRIAEFVARTGSRLDINRGMGNESISFKTGSMIRLMSTSNTSGHSKTIDQAVLDEIWHDQDSRREQGIRPAMSTRDDAQLLVCSTAGTNASTVLNSKVETGRLTVRKDTGSGIAYFEWSDDPDNDRADEDKWWRYMPALGHTIAPEVIRVELQDLPPAEFDRAYRNIPTDTDEILIPTVAWVSVNDDRAEADGLPIFGVDVAPDRSSAAIALAGANGVIELVEHRPGIGWAVERCNELTAKHSTHVALDFGGPAGVLADQLDNCIRLSGGDVIRACGAMYDAIVEDKVTFRRSPSMDEAVAGVGKKTVGDRWVWDRRGSVADATPLYAATVAYAADAPNVEPFAFFR